MKKFIPVVAAVGLVAAGGLLLSGAAPNVQEESKTDKAIKALTERAEKLEKRVVELEKRVAELEKKIAAKSAGGNGTWEDRLKGMFEKFGGNFDGAQQDFKKMLEEFGRSMPEMPGMPDFDSMPDLFQQFEGMEMDELFDMLKGQLEGQMPDFFDKLDMDGLFEQLKEKLGKSAPKKKGPKRRSI